jgi:hypothetical protein
MNAITKEAANSNVALVESPLVIQEGAAALMTAIMQFASNPAMDIEKFDRLIALHDRAEDRQIAMRERADARQAELAFNAAFVRLQGRLPRIKRDGTLEYPIDKTKPDGPKRFVSKFAKWEHIDAGIRPVLTEEGFGLSFKIAPRTVDGGGLNVSAVLRHIGGHKEIGDPFPVPLDTSGGKNNIQGYGSALSYGKKYSAFAALNVVTEGEDTDGKHPANDDGELLSRAQLAELDDLMTRTQSSEGKFLAHHDLDFRSIQQVPASEFDRLKTSLLTKASVLHQRAVLAAAARQTQNGARP